MLTIAWLLVLAMPAAAQSPGPTIHTYEVPSERPGASYDFVGGCDEIAVPDGGWDERAYLQFVCGESETSLYVMLRQPQALVELFVASSGPLHEGEGAFGDLLVVGGSVCIGRAGVTTASASAQPDVPMVTLAPAPLDWTPVAIGDPTGAPTIQCVVITGGRQNLHVDDLAFSMTADQPDTTITSGPSNSPSVDATFTFEANQPGASFECTLDGAPSSCPAPSLSGLAPGTHTLTAATRDRWGRLDLTPASHTWFITESDSDGDGSPDVRDNCPALANPEQADSDADGIGDACEPPPPPPPPPPPLPDPDRDRAADVRDNCPEAANSDQLDSDSDGLGDACDRLPPGNAPAIAGVNAIVRVESGEIFVKLPVTAGNAVRTLRAPFQDSGFVPLKGVASLPMGSVVDARKGKMVAETAANSRPIGDVRRRVQSAKFAAGIFQIRQARSRRASSRAIPTTAALVSAAGAERMCATSTRARPLKGVVRTLSVTAKGFFKVAGGASTGTAQDAIWITADRCDGTLTEVGRGRVKLRDRRRKRTVTVRGGRGYFAKAPLFLPHKGRPR